MGKGEPVADQAVSGGGRRLRMLCAAGFAALQAWVFFTLFSGLFRQTGESGFGGMYVCWCAGVVGVSVLGALPWGRMARTVGRRAMPALYDDAFVLRTRIMKVANVAAAALLFAATWLFALVGRHAAGLPFCLAASVSAGVSVGALYWSWGTVFVGSFGRGVAVRYAGSFAWGALVYAAIQWLPVFLGTAVASLLPVASSVCLSLCSDSTRGAMSRRRRVPAHCRVMFARAVATVGMLGAAEGLVRTLFYMPHLVLGILPNGLLPPVTMLLAAAIVTVVARLRSGRDTVGRVNHVLMLLMALLFLLTPILYGFGIAPDMATGLCRCLFTLCTWTVLTQVANAYRLNVRVTFAVGLGVSYAGGLAGALAGSYLAPTVVPDYRLQMVVVLACVCMVFVSLLFVADGPTFAELLDADDESPSTPRRFQLRCERAAQLYGLTAKELEVMTLIAKGRSVQRIQETLGIAASTVNTHVGHIYRKMGVHSRQEMLDFIDSDGS